MPTIIHIGYESFLVKNDAQAAKVISALAGVIGVEKRFVNKRDVFYPCKHGRTIGMETVRPDQILREKPEDEDGDVVVDCESTTNSRGQKLLNA